MSQELEFLAGVGAYRQRYKISDLTLDFPRSQSVLIYARTVDKNDEKNFNYRRRRSRPGESHGIAGSRRI